MSLESEAPDNKADLLDALEGLVKTAPVVMAKVTETEDGYNRIRVREVLETGGEVATTDDDSEEGADGEEASGDLTL